MADRVAPDVRDGLTPIGRRALVALAQAHDHVKTARTVDAVLAGGRVDGGRRAIYRELVRMARDWEMRHPLVDGQGNLGSLDGDGAASADYTQMRLAAPGADVLDDARLPNLLVNGSFGVECEAASSFPPHNLREVVDAVIAVIDAPAIGAEDLQRHLPGPDFPTGGVVVAGDGLRAAYATGHGAVVVRARADVYPLPGSPAQAIVVSELPFMVSKGGRGGVLAEIRRAIRARKVHGIDEVHDQSSVDDGLRIVVQLRREADPDAVLEQLFAHTSLQRTVTLDLVATVAGEARSIGLRSEDSVLEIVRDDLLEIAARHDDERRSEIR